MIDISSKLKFQQKPENGVYNFLPVELNQVKKIEVETYSVRAEQFDEEKILTANYDEMALFEPIRQQGKVNTLFLEIGGGDGRFSLRLMKEGFNVVETDIAPGSVARARYFAKKAGVADNNFFMALDAENLPFNDNVFNGVHMVASFHHLTDINKALNEIFRVTKSNCPVLILREPASWAYYFFWPLKMIVRYFIRKKSQGPKSLADDITMGFSKRQLTKIFASHGFKNIKITPVSYTKKYYTNYCEVKSKLFKKKIEPKQSILNKLESIDKIIAKIPLLNYFAWDWDCCMIKP